MYSVIRTQSLLDREDWNPSSTVANTTVPERSIDSESSIPLIYMSKSDCPFSVEMGPSQEDAHLGCHSWSFSAARPLGDASTSKTLNTWKYRGQETQPRSNSVDLVPVNSSSESEHSFSVDDEDEDPIILIDAEGSTETEIVSASSHSRKVQVAIPSDSHPLFPASEKTKRCSDTTHTPPPQQDMAAVCAYDCLADHFTNIFCPVERHHIESTSHKSLPNESTAHHVHAVPASAVCDPDALQMQLFPYQSEAKRSSRNFLFSSLNFWDTSHADEERKRLLLEQRTPRNRSRCSNKLRDRYLQQLQDKWYPPLLDESSSAPSVTSSVSSNNGEEIRGRTSSARRQKSRSKSMARLSKRDLNQNQQLFYDSDPEQEQRGRRKRMSSLLQSSRTGYRRFRSSMSLQVSVVEEGNDAVSAYINRPSHRNSTSAFSVSTEEEGDGSTSYETAQNNTGLLPPPAPRHGNRISFDFVTGDGAHPDRCETTVEESILTGSNNSTISLSTAAGDDAGEDTVVESSPTLRVSSTASSVLSSSNASTKLAAPLDEVEPRPSHHLHMPLPIRSVPPFFQAPTKWTEFHLLYSGMEDFTKTHVQELSNVRFPLIWHPVGRTKKKKTLATALSSPSKTPCPLACHAVFEVGAHLDHMVVQPKFTWSPILQPNLETDRKILLSGSQPFFVELLSIIRVNVPTDANTSVKGNKWWDRRKFPFCRLDRTLCVTTNDLNHPYLVFEARSTCERDWLVMALKLIVARLASIIIVRDEDMLLEFFSPYSALMQLDDNDSDDDEELGDHAVLPRHDTKVCRSSKRLSPQNAVENLSHLGKKKQPHRRSSELLKRGSVGDDSDRQDVSLDDDDYSSLGDEPTEEFEPSN